MFPDCLPSVDLDYDTATAEEQAMMDYLKMKEMEFQPLVYLSCWVDADSGADLCYPEMYGEETDIYVDRMGNLCTDISSVD